MKIPRVKWRKNLNNGGWRSPTINPSLYGRERTTMVFNHSESTTRPISSHRMDPTNRSNKWPLWNLGKETRMRISRMKVVIQRKSLHLWEVAKCRERLFSNMISFLRNGRKNRVKTLKKQVKFRIKNRRKKNKRSRRMNQARLLRRLSQKLKARNQMNRLRKRSMRQSRRKRKMGMRRKRTMMRRRRKGR